MQQIKERGALPMIDRGDIRQAIDRCSNIWASLPGAGYGQFRLERQPDCIKAGEMVEDGNHGEVFAIISVVIIIILLYHDINRHYRRRAIYSVNGKNAEELEAGVFAAITDMQMRQRDVAALDAKYTGVS